MTRTSHFSSEVGIPIYSLNFLSDDLVVYAGGGGAGKSGVTNALVVASIDHASQSLKEVNKLTLSRDEDAPMSMAVNLRRNQIVCGINSTAEMVKQGKNKTLRIFEFNVSNDSPSGQGGDAADQAQAGEGQHEGEKKNGQITAKLELLKAEESLRISDPEHYQKVAVFSVDGKMLAVASTDGKIVLHRYPSLQPVWTPSSGTEEKEIPEADFVNDEICDADFSESGTHIAFTSSSKLGVYSTAAHPFKGSVDQDDSQGDVEGEGSAQAIQTIKNPALGGKGPCSFRAARFGRGDASREKLFTVVNAAPGGGRGPKAKVRKSFVTAWDADSWDLIETRHVSDRPVTAFDVSADGRLLAYGSSDLSIGVLDSRTLRPILKILHAHDFPPTCLRFSPSGETLVSGSADNTLRIIKIPSRQAQLDLIRTSSLFQDRGRLAILLALVLVGLAYWFQLRLSRD
ncbi:WD40 repeat-like protein [Violaceomyces palustris]|uniref:WD40 repeat-like protein n=1 Tax=Violaceomyces palustris TaxID=1673888 RepID=A0ACD0NMB5_9BASI|nr:WD40 repeat-like protein [Violaceomyces palustris]